MTFFYRNTLLIHVLLLVLAFSWIHGGTRPDLLLPVIPWLTFFMVEMLLVFPQAKSSETLPEARQRVWRALVRDPLLYVLLLLLVLLVLPFFNITGEPAFNPAKEVWRIDPPPHPKLPFCVIPHEHAVLLLWFPPAILAALAVRHGLLKKGKRLLLALLCWNGAALALLGLLQLLTNAESIYWGSEKFSYFFSTFGYPNFAGAFFTLHFALSLGLWFNGVFDERLGPSTSIAAVELDIDTKSASPHWFLVPLVFNLAGAVASLSRAAILLCGLVILIYGLYMLVGAWQSSTRGGRILMFSAMVGLLFCGGLGLTILAPKALKEELVTITPEAVVERVASKTYYQFRIAKAIHADHFLFGVGGWGYPHYLQLYLTPEERKHMQIQGGANVHNDVLQMLAEQGIIGFGLLLISALLLAVPLLLQSGRLSYALSKSGIDLVTAKPLWFFRISPLVLAVFVGTTATVCHSFGDLPFRCPAILLVWMLAFVCAAGFLPTMRRKQQPRTSHP